MKTKKKDTMWWRRMGGIFQLPMIVIWLIRGAFIAKPISGPIDGMMYIISETLFIVGAVLTLTCLLRIYRRSPEGKVRQLITADVFAITRHPMYHGMFLFDLKLFFHSDLTQPLFWISWVIFVLLILVAGWFQEKETLANWKEEAREYYRLTPRFVFEWIWFWVIRPKKT